MAEVKWIRISTDIFENKKIRLLESLDDGDTLIVIWFKLLAMAGNLNDNGYVYFTEDMPYTIPMLATVLNRPRDIVERALKTFQDFGMIEMQEDIIYVSNWDKYQNIDGLEKIREQNRIRQQRNRDKKKIESKNKSNVTDNVTDNGTETCIESSDNVTVTDSNVTDNVMDNVTVTLRHAIDIDKDIDINNKRESKKRKSAAAFSPPTVEEVEAYCQERNNGIDAQHFLDYYQSRNWMYGKTKITDWKAAVRTWEKKQKEHDTVPTNQPRARNFVDIPVSPSYQGNMDELEELLLEN